MCEMVGAFVLWMNQFRLVEQLLVEGSFRRIFEGVIVMLISCTFEFTNVRMVVAGLCTALD